MRILICDDTVEFTEKLKEALCEFFDENKLLCPEIIVYHSGEELLADTGKKDLVFLDVEMTGLSGIHVGKILKSQNKKAIIFIVTSFSEYLDDAMDFQVFRYLTKPIDKKRLYRSLKQAIKQYNSNFDDISFSTKEETFVVSTEVVVMVEVLGRKTRVYTDTTSYLTSHPLSYWLEFLTEPHFFQTHRSYIINMQYVQSFNHTVVNLNNNQCSAYLTRRKYTEFKETYLMYLENTR